MAIYTRKGDRGQTSLYGGKTVLKSADAIGAYGTIDELSSFIGLVISMSKGEKKLLTIVQTDLYQIMACLAGADTKTEFIKNRLALFEKEIDKIDGSLPPIRHFILPQGTEISCWFHILRTVCRRAERFLVRYIEGKKNLKTKSEIISYLNRLSDLFFILARKYNNQKEVAIIK